MDLGNKAVIEKKPKAKVTQKLPAPKLPDEQGKTASKAPGDKPKAKARPAGAEADVEMTPTDATQPKVPKRPAGAVASEPSAAAKPAVKAKAMPAVSSPLSENEIVALQSRAVPGASNLPHLNSKQVWLSRRVSGLLRGWEHSKKTWQKVQPPSFEKGLWMDYTKVYSFIKRKYAVNLTNDELLRAITPKNRFMLEVKIAPKGTLVGGKYQYTPLRIKVIQNHNKWSYNTVQDALPELKRFVSLNPEYDSEIAPTIVYRYTHQAALLDIINMGLIPGGNRTGAKHTFLTKEDLWTDHLWHRLRCDGGNTTSVCRLGYADVGAAWSSPD